MLLLVAITLAILAVSASSSSLEYTLDTKPPRSAASEDMGSPDGKCNVSVLVLTHDGKYNCVAVIMIVIIVSLVLFNTRLE